MKITNHKQREKLESVNATVVDKFATLLVVNVLSTKLETKIFQIIIYFV